MTAFARTEQATDWGRFSWEVRSVNQRYLEMHFKLPENQRYLEMAIRDKLKQALHRGKIEVSLKVEEGGKEASFAVNQDVLQPLSQAVCEVQQSLMEATQVNPLEVLNWPGVLETQSESNEARQACENQLLQSLDDAIEKLIANRKREGEALKTILEARATVIEEQVEQARQLLPEIIATQTEKLRQRIVSLLEEHDEMRLHQEVAIMAQKLDVQEELDRLSTHLTEVRHVLGSKGAIGRRLDFLMQELNREANTLGSKSADSRTSQISVEIKVLIEQMREQVQNIE